MKILSIEAVRVRKLNLVSLKLDGDNLVVSGEPNQGKTTLINLLWMAMDAKKIGREVITAGEKDGYINIELGEPGQQYSVRITRKFSENGPASGKLKITSADGQSLKASFLNDIVSNLTFDPLNFLRQKGQEQVNMLLSVSSVSIDDLEAMDFERKTLYDDRTMANRDVNKWKSIVGEEPEKVDRVDVNELSKKLTEIKIHNDRVNKMERQLEELSADYDEYTAEWEAAQKRIKELDECMKILQSRIEKGIEVCKKYKIIDERPELEKLTNMEEINRSAEKWDSWQRGSAQLIQSEGEVTVINAAINKIDLQKSDILSKAKWPIKGMDVREGDIYIDDILLNNCGESQKLQVSFAVSMSLNPTLKCCRLDGAESLGKSGRKNILEMANEHGYQVLMSRVSDDGPGDGEIVIEEGVVK